MNAEKILSFYDKIAEAPEAVSGLRSFILNCAMRGKLVQQDPNDESASELLKQIESEKKRLNKSKENKKSKPTPEIEEAPYELPASWRWTRIRQITSDRGQSVPDKKFTYIDVTAIDKEKGVIVDSKVLESDQAPSRARKITQKGDVLYSCVRPYLLNVAIVEKNFKPAPIASTAFAVLNGHGLVLPRYIWIWCRSPFAISLVEEKQRGQAYPAINDRDFSMLPFPLPPLAEQKRIVAKVDELMALCDDLEANLAARDATRKDLMEAVLRGAFEAPA